MPCIPSLSRIRSIKPVLLSIAASALLSASFPARCGPPFVTDDAGILEYRQHELFVGADYTDTRSGRTVTPFVDYSYGVSPGLQLGVTLPYVIDSQTGQPRQHGLGDIVLGAKYRLVQETDRRPMLTVAPLVATASGNAGKGLGNGGSQLFLPIWIQKGWGDWQSYGGGGYWINHAPGAGNHWYYGAALQYDISARVTLGAELFHETDQLPSDTSSTGYSLGTIYNLDPQHRLLFSVGRGLKHSSAQDRTSGYFSYAFTL